MFSNKYLFSPCVISPFFSIQFRISCSMSTILHLFTYEYHLLAACSAAFALPLFSCRRRIFVCYLLHLYLNKFNKFQRDELQTIIELTCQNKIEMKGKRKNAHIFRLRKWKFLRRRRITKEKTRGRVEKNVEKKEMLNIYQRV